MIREGITHSQAPVSHEPPVQQGAISPSETDMDPVTGLYSRDFFYKAAEDEIERCKRYKSILSVLSIGIDRLPTDSTVKVSSSFIQKEVAGLIKSRFRKVDIAARTADKLFQVVLPGTDMRNAKIVAEQFSRIVRETKFHYKDNDIHITCSCGIAVHKYGDTTDTLLARSKTALNEAKNMGKNRIVVL
jgi:diguanylate cyclase